MKRWLMAALVMAGSVQGADFEKGQKYVSFSVGAGSGFNTTYTIVGVSASYFVLRGLSVGAGYRGWFGGTPTMQEIELPVTYFLPLEGKVRPYVGGFVRHTFISSGYTDYDTYGARAGISYIEGKGYVSAGWVQEWYSNDNGSDSSRGYPEIAAGLKF